MENLIEKSVELLSQAKEVVAGSDLYERAIVPIINGDSDEIRALIGVLLVGLPLYFLPTIFSLMQQGFKKAGKFFS